MEVLTFPLNLEITTELNRHPGMDTSGGLMIFETPNWNKSQSLRRGPRLSPGSSSYKSSPHSPLDLGTRGRWGLWFSLLHRWSPCPSSQSFALVITRSSVLKWEISHTWAVKFKGWSQLKLLETWDRINVVLALLRREKTTEKSTNSAC